MFKFCSAPTCMQGATLPLSLWVHFTGSIGGPMVNRKLLPTYHRRQQINRLRVINTFQQSPPSARAVARSWFLTVNASSRRDASPSHARQTAVVHRRFKASRRASRNRQVPAARRCRRCRPAYVTEHARLGDRGASTPPRSTWAPTGSFWAEAERAGDALRGTTVGQGQQDPPRRAASATKHRAASAPAAPAAGTSSGVPRSCGYVVSEPKAVTPPTYHRKCAPAKPVHAHAPTGGLCSFRKESPWIVTRMTSSVALRLSVTFGGFRWAAQRRSESQAFARR